MATRKLTYPFSDFAGGLNNSIASHQIADNEAQDLLNVLLDDKSISQRLGSQILGRVNVNLLTQNQATAETDTTGFTAVGAATITRDTTTFHSGVASTKVVTTAVVGQGVNIAYATPIVSGKNVFGSMYVKGTAGVIVILKIEDVANGLSATYEHTFDGTWQRINVNQIIGALPSATINLSVTTQSAVATTFYIDDNQLELDRLTDFVAPNNQLPGSPIKSIFNFKKTDGTEIPIATAGTAVYKWTGTAWNALITGLSDGKDFTFVVYNDVLYLSNGYDTPRKYDGTTVTSLTAAPLGKYIIQFQNYLFVMGIASTPNRLYWSALADPTSWPALNYIDINSNDGDYITGVTAVGMGANARLLIFKKTSMWVISDSNNPASLWKLECINTSVGCVSHKSIVRTRGLTMFLGTDGIYRYNGLAVVSQPISDRVKKSLNSINKSKLSLAVGCVDDNKYRLFIPTGSNAFCDTGIVYNYERNNFTLFSGTKPNGYTIYLDNLYSADDTGNVLRLNIGDNDYVDTVANLKTAINAYYITKDIAKVGDQDRIEYKKSYREIFALLKSGSGSLDVQFSVDDSTYTNPELIDQTSTASKWGSFIWGVDKWGGGEKTKFYSWNIHTKGRKINFKISNDRVDETFALYYLVMEYKPTAKPKGV